MEPRRSGTNERLTVRSHIRRVKEAIDQIEGLSMLVLESWAMAVV